MALAEATQLKKRNQLKAFWSANAVDEGDASDEVANTDQANQDAKDAADAAAADAEVIKQLEDSQVAAQKDESTDTNVEVPKHVAQTYGDWNDWPAATPKIPAVAAPADVTYPTIAQDQGAPPKPALAVPIPTPESPTGPTDLTTDPETGTRFVQDPELGKIPHAELATEADRIAQPPGTQLPQVNVAGNVLVRRAELIDPDPDLLYTTPSAETPPVAAPPAVVPPIPDKLSQVEKALPAHEVAPDKLSQVEPGQIVSTPPGTAPRAIGRAALIPEPPKVQQGELVNVPPGTAPQALAVPYDGPPAMNAPNGNAPSALIIHHTSGRNGAESVVDDWRTNRPGVGAQMIMDRDGTIHETAKEFGYNGTGNFLHSVIPGVSNRTAVGIEVIAKDDADMTDAQLASLQRLAGPDGPYANVPVYGHSQVSPGDRDNEGVRGVNAINQARAGQPAGPPKQSWESWATADGAQTSAAPVTAGPPQHGFYPDEDSTKWVTGRATSFGGADDVAKFNAAKKAGLSDKEARSVGDDGIGSPWLGKLSTNNDTLQGVAIPEEVLRSNFGNNYAAMREARVDVVDTVTGQRMRVPIVDVGPRDTSTSRGVVTDMTGALFKAFGGDNNHKFALNIVPNAGSDVMKNPQDFWNEQAAIRKVGDVGAVTRAAAQPKAEAWQSWATLSPAEQASADTAQQFQAQGQKDSLSVLAEQTPNLAALIKRLDSKVEGVSDSTRKQFQDGVKEEATKYAQDYYGIADPKKALDLAMSNVGPTEFAGEVLSKVIPNFGKADVAISSFLDSADEKRVKQFFDTIEPNATTEAKAQEIQKLRDTPANLRGPVINALIAHTDETTAKAIGEPGNILDSLNRIADPKYQADRSAAIAEKQAWVDKSLRTDPRMVGTPAEFITQQLAALPKNIFESLLPPGARETAFYAEIYTDAKAQARRDHPEMSEGELDKQATASAIVQMVPQEVLSAAMGGKLGAITSRIENPVQRIAASALLHTGIGAAAGATQQAAANVVAGKPVGEDVLPAAAGGAIQTIPGGLAAGVHGWPVEVAPERPLAERAVQGPPGPPLPEVTRASVLGPDVPDLSVPWYDPRRPIVTRPTERTTFTPAELEEAVQQARTAGTPEQIRAALDKLQPPSDFSRRTVHATDQPFPLEDTGAPAEVRPPPPTQTQEDVARKTYENVQARVQSGTPGTPLNDYAKAQRDLYRAKETAPVTVGESESHVSAIANRFTAERIARGEIGEVAPGEGYSKEELRMAGLKMGPQEIDQHVSDLMHNTGNPKLQAAAVTAHEAFLSQRAYAASREAAANPNNHELQIADNQAFHDLTDFYNGPVAKIKNNWHATGMTLQGEVHMDLSTYNGLRERFLRETGDAPPSSMEPKLRKLAKAVSDSAVEDKASMQKLGSEIERQSARRPLPTDEELRNRISEVLKEYPCRT